MAHWIEGKGWSDNCTPRVVPTPKFVPKPPKAKPYRTTASIIDFANQYGEGRGYQYIREKGMEFAKEDLVKIAMELMKAINHGKVLQDFDELDVAFIDSMAEYAGQKGEFEW